MRRGLTFRREVSLELGDRQGAERRYSLRLRQWAVAYWKRKRAGDGLHASRLSLAPESLRRWAQDDRFRPVEAVPDPAPPTGVSVVIEGTRIRVDGLDLDTAAQMIARLR